MQAVGAGLNDGADLASRGSAVLGSGSTGDIGILLEILNRRQSCRVAGQVLNGVCSINLVTVGCSSRSIHANAYAVVTVLCLHGAGLGQFHVYPGVAPNHWEC